MAVTVTTATDVYGIGAVLYALLTGGPPFAGGTLLETLEQVRSHDPAWRPAVAAPDAAHLETICLKCLAKEPLAVCDGRRVGGRTGSLFGRSTDPGAPGWCPGSAHEMGSASAGVAALVAVNGRRPWSRSSCWSCFITSGCKQKCGGPRTAKQRLKGSASRADANYHEARETIDRMLNRLEAKRLAGLPQVTELRRDLLEDSLKFYQRVLGEQDSPEPDVRSDAAQAFHRTAVIQAGLGRPAPRRRISAAPLHFSRNWPCDILTF